ncbi:MOSC domain-containing protein [Halioglobus maricola]|uniref:MOSC domain-containing protein n=1 Tax=Halioglobus maricola TaxID=2601894 RepID=A0A5P9NMU6_9GAMM|nr:MOSC domain-containing protein [Halioglobus maricola]QFU76949.1 MOSC domain-containing protein [Halioglobus maricola]
MRVLATNISQPREIQFRGETHLTGIFKTPTEEPVYLGREGVRNDAVIDLVNHGGRDKAIYAFASDHYDYWRDTLDKPDMPPGAFGENLTISGLIESDIHIGDQLAIGNAILEVSQPRVPCFKLGIALNDERAPALFTRHFFTGVYFRVLREGEVRAGDTASIVHRHGAAVSVHSLFRARYDSAWDSATETMESALDVAALAPEWQEKARTYLARR